MISLTMPLIFRGLREPLTLNYLHEPLITALRVVLAWSNRRGWPVRITSLCDHTHSAKSLHYDSLACDLQVSLGNGHPHKKAMHDLAATLRAELPLGYDILFGDKQHKTHVHIEADTRPRTTQTAY